MLGDEQNVQIGAFKQSFYNALRGLYYVVRNERNFQIELFAGVVIILMALVLRVESWEAVALFFMVLWVLTAELLNTVLEKIVDILKPRIHPYARIIKDIMAAAVLVASFFSLLIGAVIFWPHIVRLF